MHSDDDHIEDFEKLNDEDFKGLELAGQNEFVSKLKSNRKKAAKAMKVFAKGLGNEAKETREASKILVKFLAEGKVSPEEEKELKTQVYDLFKMVGIGIPFFMIPGSSLLLPFLIRISSRYGVNLLPTSFTNKEEEEEEEEI
jgi:hypothetical protein